MGMCGSRVSMSAQRASARAPPARRATSRTMHATASLCRAWQKWPRRREVSGGGRVTARRQTPRGRNRCRHRSHDARHNRGDAQQAAEGPPRDTRRPLAFDQQVICAVVGDRRCQTGSELCVCLSAPCGRYGAGISCSVIGSSSPHWCSHKEEQPE